MPRFNSQGLHPSTPPSTYTYGVGSKRSQAFFSSTGLIVMPVFTDVSKPLLMIQCSKDRALARKKEHGSAGTAAYGFHIYFNIYIYIFTFVHVVHTTKRNILLLVFK